MRLLDYMREEELDDEALAQRLGDCSSHAVKKWKYGEREPDAPMIERIEAVTDGKVRLSDWAQQTTDRRAKRASSGAPAPRAA